MESININEMLAQMKTGEIATKSTKGMYDTRLQEASSRESAKMHKNEKGAIYKSLPLKILSIPFNPLTGEIDENHNTLSPFISTKSVNSTIKALKENANKVASAKEKLMSFAGLTSWDTSDCSVITDEDKRIFSMFSKPRMFTIPIFTIRYPKMLTKETRFGLNFGLTCDRDPITMDIIGEIPEVLQLGQFHRALNTERIARFEELFKKGKRKETKVEFDNRIKGWKEGVGISWEKRSNYLASVEFTEADLKKVTNKDTREISYDLLPTITPETIKDSFVYIRVTEKLKTCLGKFNSEDNYEANLSSEFYDMTIECGSKGDAQEVGKETTFSPSDSKKVLFGKNGYEVLEDSISAYLDNIKDQEEMCKNSAYIRVYTDETHKTVLNCAREDIGKLLDDTEFGELLTQKIFDKYKDIIELLFPERIGKLTSKFVMGKMEEGDEVNEESLKTEGKDQAYSLESAALGESIEELKTSDTIKDMTEGVSTESIEEFEG